MTLSGTTFSSTALYECDDGFVLVGDEVRVCQDSGEWTGEDPECIGMYNINYLLDYRHTNKHVVVVFFLV